VFLAVGGQHTMVTVGNPDELTCGAVTDAETSARTQIATAAPTSPSVQTFTSSKEHLP